MIYHIRVFALSIATSRGRLTSLSRRTTARVVQSEKLNRLNSNLFPLVSLSGTTLKDEVDKLKSSRIVDQLSSIGCGYLVRLESNGRIDGQLWRCT